MENVQKIRRMLTSPALAGVWRWSKPVRVRVALICLMGIVATLASLGVTLATRSLIDGAVSGQSGTLWRYGGILVALIFLQRAVSVLTALLRNRSEIRMRRGLQTMLVESLLGKEYASLKGYHSGEIINRYFSDVGVVQNGILNVMPGIVRMLVSFVGAAAILISMDWHFVPVLIAGGLLGLGIVLLFRNPIKTRHKRMQEAQDALHASVQETIENVRLIKASVSEERAKTRLDGYQTRMGKEQVRQGRFSIAMNNSMGVVFDCSWLFCMIWGCTNIFHGNMTYGALAALIQLIGRIQGPIANAVSMAAQIYGVIASAERLQELTELPEENQGEVLEDFDAIRLSDVTFQYDDGVENVLRNINCTIRKGDFMALTGMSGGGKTSLFQLLLGIYKPTFGQIVFQSGEREVPASRGTRPLFAYVPQGNTLFSGTLRDNLTMFTDHADEDEIRKAVRSACIEDLVAEMGLEATLGERGKGLSEGQAQRVAVARALMSKAPILLLDEATSALDEETEARMLKNISEMRNRTCIIVTHRRAALGICDYTLHISEGRATPVSQSGSGA